MISPHLKFLTDVILFKLLREREDVSVEQVAEHFDCPYVMAEGLLDGMIELNQLFILNGVYRRKEK